MQIIDSRILSLITFYNSNGYVTEQSCEGHYYHADDIFLNHTGAVTYIEFIYDEAKYQKLLNNQRCIESFFPQSKVIISENVLDEGTEDEFKLMRIIIDHPDETFENKKTYEKYLEKGILDWEVMIIVNKDQCK